MVSHAPESEVAKKATLDMYRNRGVDRVIILHWGEGRRFELPADINLLRKLYLNFELLAMWFAVHHLHGVKN